MISTKQVKKIAELSYLKLTEKESQKYAEELSKIIDFFELLKKIDTEDVEPLLSSCDLEDVMFEDRAKNSPSNKELIKRAPESKDNSLKTKPILNQ